MFLKTETSVLGFIHHIHSF